MASGNRPQGELYQALMRSRSALGTIGLVSAALNILLLGGSLYLMLVYDSVIPSQSVPTLVALFAMIIVVYVFQGLFDVLRSRLLADVGAAMDLSIGSRLQQVVDRVALEGLRGDAGQPIADPIRDFDQIRGYVSSPALAAMMDLPWIVFYLALLTVLHYWLGFVTFIGALVMLALAWVSDSRSRAPTETVNRYAAERRALVDEKRRHSEIVRSMGMGDRLWNRWSEVNRKFLEAQASLTGSAGTLGAVARAFRLVLQSAVLTVGALLVIAGNATGGIIFASSILSSRALAPLDQAITNWRTLAAVRSAWARLERILAAVPDARAVTTALPAPASTLATENLAVAPPGVQRIVAAGVTFTLSAGEAMCIVGPSAAGKSSVARALANVWQPVRGSVTLDGAALRQWEPEVLGTYLGYLPQTVELLTGTIAENIARFEMPIDSEAVVAAARAAGVHDMIVAMPQGYDTFVGIEGSQLSGGQRQRVGLARALYRDPFLVVLDEPDSNLDAMGEAALDAAIASVRQRRGIAIIVAHRVSAVGRCTHALVMKDGAQSAFGPVDKIFQRKPSTDGGVRVTAGPAGMPEPKA